VAAEPPEQTFELVVPVVPADVDELGHVNNTVYLQWVQEVATAHWKALASAEAQAEVVWVVVRHEIDYKVPALPGDEVLLRTWVGNATRVTFERHTQILHASRGQLLAQARTLWCPINTTTRKPHRVSAEVRAQFST
jgi:acyl-CoA thioester hydrolase